jgi:magnesium chelatase subunit I
VIRRRDSYERNPAAFLRRWRPKDAEIRDRILAARDSLSAVKTPKAVLKDCAGLCVALGSDGLRGELTLLRAGRALAAYEGAETLTREHLRDVASMALSHRLRRDPLDEAGSGARVSRTVEEVLV